MYFGPIYLHFLNRELLRSVCVSSKLPLSSILLRCSFFSSGRLVAPLSALVEGYTERSAEELDVLGILTRHQHLELVSDAACLEDFIDARRILYQFDQSRYPFYFAKTNLPDWMSPVILKQTSATLELETASIIALDSPIEKKSSLPIDSISANERKHLIETVMNRHERALTMSLFEHRAAPQVIRMMGRFLSERYIAHYASFLEAEIITGIRGLQFFDQFSEAFPFLDLPCADIVLSAASAKDLVVPNYKCTASEIAMHIAANKETKAHFAMVHTFQTLIDKARKIGQVKPRSHAAIRGVVSATLSQAASTFDWRPLSWRHSKGQETIQDLSERLKLIAERISIDSLPSTGWDTLDYNKNHSKQRMENTSMAKFVFVSYVRDDADIVDAMCNRLRSEGLSVWQDRTDLYPGQRWKLGIRRAISEGAFAFIACFSKKYEERTNSYMNEEIVLAIEEIRKRPHDRSWFIPVRLNEAKVPDRSIGGGETLLDIQHVDLFPDWDKGCNKLLSVLKTIS